MRKLVFFLLFINVVFAQTPQKMSYQAIIRNASNVLVSNANVGIKISILQGNISGVTVYSETHTVVTNTNGIATLMIGDGAILSGDFSTINWANGPYFIKTETDPLGGSSYTISGTSQLLSVPYALLSEKAVKPTYPVSASNYSETNMWTSVRNSWVSDPGISLIVPETGKYLLSFYGNAYAPVGYITSGSYYDTGCQIRVFNNTTSNELINRSAVNMYGDAEVSYSYWKYMPAGPSGTIIVNLNQGDELLIQYFNSAYGTPPSGWQAWNIGKGGLTLLKIGE